MIRVPDSEKWNADKISKLIATPRQPNPKDEDQK